MSQQRPCHTQLCVGTLNAVDVRSSILIRLPGCLPQIATAASKQQQQEGPARSSKEHSIQLLSPSALLAWPSARRGKNKRSERVPKEVRMVSTYTTANLQSILENCPLKWLTKLCSAKQAAHSKRNIKHSMGGAYLGTRKITT